MFGARVIDFNTAEPPPLADDDGLLLRDAASGGVEHVPYATMTKIELQRGLFFGVYVIRIHRAQRGPISIRYRYFTAIGARKVRSDEYVSLVRALLARGVSANPAMRIVGGSTVSFALSLLALVANMYPAVGILRSMSADIGFRIEDEPIVWLFMCAPVAAACGALLGQGPSRRLAPSRLPHFLLPPTA